MPAPSTRIATLTDGGDDGWGIFRRARALKAAGHAVLELTIGEHDIGTAPEILDEMHRAAQAGATGYASTQGIGPLRAAVAERLTARHGTPYTPDNILIVPGAQAGLFAAHHAACDEGARALMIDPYYTTYPGTIRAVGARPVAVAARSEDGFQPDLAALAAAAPGARSLLINSPNNPTGAVYSQASLDGIARIAEDHDLWVIADEVYDTQIWAGAHIPFAALPGMAARTLTVGSMSKSHAMTGSRLGWVAGPAEAIGCLASLATHTTYGVPGYIQEAGLFALRQGAAMEAEVAAVLSGGGWMLLADRVAEPEFSSARSRRTGRYVMLDIPRPGPCRATRSLSRLLGGNRRGVDAGEASARPRQGTAGGR